MPSPSWDGTTTTPRKSKWIEGKYDLSADEAADLLYGMMPETLSCYWVAKNKGAAGKNGAQKASDGEVNNMIMSASF